MARKHSEGCGLDMTPMIDVVFQLMIFFIVTIKMESDVNPEIRLPDAKHGPIIEEIPPQMLVVEVDQHGTISMRNARLTPDHFRNLMVRRYNQIGPFPVLIRADRRAKHWMVKRVMDMCTEAGIWKIQFAGIQEDKTPDN